MATMWRYVFCFCPRESRTIYPLPHSEVNVPNTQHSVTSEEPKPVGSPLTNSEDATIPADKINGKKSGVEVKTELKKEIEDRVEINDLSKQDNEVQAELKVYLDKNATVEDVAITAIIEGLEIIEKKDATENKIEETATVRRENSHAEGEEVKNSDPVEETLKKAAEIMKELSKDEPARDEQEEKCNNVMDFIHHVKYETSHPCSPDLKESTEKAHQDEEECEAKQKQSLFVKEEAEKNGQSKGEKKRGEKFENFIKVRATEVRELPKKICPIKNMDLPRMKKDVQVKFKDDTRKETAIRPKKKVLKKSKIAGDIEETQGKIVVMSPCDITFIPTTLFAEQIAVSPVLMPVKKSSSLDVQIKRKKFIRRPTGFPDSTESHTTASTV